LRRIQLNVVPNLCDNAVLRRALYDIGLLPS
jgi:hypothetical protein